MIDITKLTQTDILTLLYLIIPYLLYMYNLCLVLAPILSLFYIIFAGLKFSASSGNPAKIQSAKQTLTAAIVGCVLVLLAYPIINVVAYIFTPEASPSRFLDWYTDSITALALIYIGYGGIKYIMSSGKPLQISEAKRTIFYAIEGYIWLLLMRILLSGFIT